MSLKKKEIEKIGAKIKRVEKKHDGVVQKTFWVENYFLVILVVMFTFFLAAFMEMFARTLPSFFVVEIPTLISYGIFCLILFLLILKMAVDKNKELHKEYHEIASLLDEIERDQKNFEK